MVHLLEVNVLVALFDPTHLHHEAAHHWFEQAREYGWATRPLTENGFLRVLSDPTDPGRRTTVAAYLLALAVYRGGRLATFDRNVRLPVVPGARTDHLTVVVPRG